MKTQNSRRKAGLLAAAAVSAGALATTVAVMPAASAAPVKAAPASTAIHTLHVRQIAFGVKLFHRFRPNGKGALHAEPLTKPDDITELNGHLFVTFQNGVGPQGEASTDGNTDSTIVEFTLAGRDVRQWELVGKCDGVTADPAIGQVIATVNEDAHSRLYTIAPATGHLEHYRYSEALPSKGGTDAISIYHGQIMISASAPGTTGTAAPKASYPAVYVTTLHPGTGVAAVRPLFGDEWKAKTVNGPAAGKVVHLALTDPDSNEVVPASSPRFAGDFMLTAQGDKEQIFDHPTGARVGLKVLHLANSVDDTAWATARSGALYVTDGGTDTLDRVSGPFTVGTTYVGVTPCDANGSPATCPGPGFAADYLGTENLNTGALAAVPLTEPALDPAGIIFLSS